MDFNKDALQQGTKERVSAVRFRTWFLTAMIVVTLIFYFLVQVTTRQSINIIDFIISATLQIVMHLIYFPDGELFGANNKVYKFNKSAYNLKANKVNNEGHIEKLREYCDYDYEERKKQYIKAEYGALGLTQEEVEKLHFTCKEDIKKLKFLEICNEDKSKCRLVFLDKRKKKRLIRLLFEEIPIKPNAPETIMSAIESDTQDGNIRDGSTTFKSRSFKQRIFKAIVVGGIFAYIGYTLRDGIGIEQITAILIFLTTICTTAVMAFTSGEKCTKVYKSNFYLQLANFIDGFFEWAKIPQNIDKSE